MSGERMRVGSALRSISPLLLVGIWLACVVAHAAYYMSSILAHAADIPDLNVRSRGYLLLMFAFVRFPIWLGVLLAVLLLRGSRQRDV
jgi:hypothetical protein